MVICNAIYTIIIIEYTEKLSDFGPGLGLRKKNFSVIIYIRKRSRRITRRGNESKFPENPAILPVEARTAICPTQQLRQDQSRPLT